MKSNQRNCGDKFAFGSRRAAVARARVMSGRYGKVGAYLCANCGRYHIGHASVRA